MRRHSRLRRQKLTRETTNRIATDEHIFFARRRHRFISLAMRLVLSPTQVVVVCGVDSDC